MKQYGRPRTQGSKGCTDLMDCAFVERPRHLRDDRLARQWRKSARRMPRGGW